MQSRGEPSWGLCPRATGKFEANHSPSGTGVTVASRRAAPYPEGSFWPVSTVRGSAAIRPESEDKPTLRGHRGNGADDPFRTSGNIYAVAEPGHGGLPQIGQNRRD